LNDPPPLASLAVQQKSFLHIFYFAAARFFLLKGKENFFAGFCSKRAGRRGFASAGGQKFLPQTPFSFCPPALWQSLSRLLKMGGAKNFSEDDGLQNNKGGGFRFQILDSF